MGPPIRMGFDNGGQAQAGNGFPTPYTHHSPPAPFSQPTYQPYPPQSFSDRSSLDSYPYNSQRGRGNMNHSRGGRGRGDFQSRGRDNNRQNGASRASSDSFQSPAGAENGGGKKNKKKRRTNTLGLTPNGAESDDGDDDVDEEARLVTLLGPDVPQYV
jgi:hypothetical protein